MPGRYAPRSFKQFDPSSVQGSAPTARDQRNESDADLWNFIGDVAPIAGTVIGGVGGAFLGGPGGAMAGAGLGQGLGQGVGSLSKNHASGLTEKRDNEMANKEQRRQEMLAILSSLRR